MIDYTIGDKVVCIKDDILNLMEMLEYQVKNFEFAEIGRIYTVKDIFADEEGSDWGIGVQFEEICAGIDYENDEWWFEAEHFRKVTPLESEEIKHEYERA